MIATSRAYSSNCSTCSHVTVPVTGGNGFARTLSWVVCSRRARSAWLAFLMVVFLFVYQSTMLEVNNRLNKGYLYTQCYNLVVDSIMSHILVALVCGHIMQ